MPSANEGVRSMGVYNSEDIGEIKWLRDLEP